MIKRLLTLLALLLGLSLSAFAQAQSKLPPCPPVDYSKNTSTGIDGRTGKWHNCYGRYVFELDTVFKGSVFAGEFRNGVFNGHGMMTFANGEVSEGIWEDGRFVRAKKINLPPVNQQTDVAINEDRRKLDSDRQAQSNDINSNLFVIQPQFESVDFFSEGLSSVRIGDEDSGKYGFIDQKGKFVINPQFSYASYFNKEGFALVRVGDSTKGKYGFINKQGEFVINPQFNNANVFSEGLASVQIGDDKTGKWGYIDKQGKMVIKPQFNYAEAFDEGLAIVRIGGKKTEKWGFVDRQGNFIIKPQFDEIHGFFEGLALVRVGDSTKGKYGFIDKKGKMVIKPQFDHAGYFNEELAQVRVGDEKTGKYGFINKHGEIVINPQFVSTGYFYEGLARVKIGDEKTGKWGYINKQGKMVINPQFNYADDFTEGLARVDVGSRKFGKYGFINKQGEFVINPQFNYADDFTEGLAYVQVGDDKTGKWGYIDKQGKMVIKPQFDSVVFFSEGIAQVRIGDEKTGKWGFISKESAQSSKLATLTPEQKKQDDNKQSSKLALQTTTTNPDVNGNVIITVRTNTDTSSLKVNGNEEGGKSDGNYTIKRIARVGQDTEYTIVATDVFGNTASTTITVGRQTVSSSSNQSASLKPENIKRAPSRDAVAIIIGIQNYKRVPKADFANNDAKEFYEYAIRGLGIKPENIKLLVDEEADEVNIVKAFENWLPLQVNKGKTDVYVFYSGHGLPSSDGKSLYFLPHGVDKELLSRTAVGQAEVVSALVASKPKSVTMFIDACYSGQTRGGETLLASAKPIALKTDANAFPSNFTVITASANDQISSSSPELKHGIFSFFLMKGMEGDADGNRDGKITAGEMQEYLSDKVSRQAMSMSRKQDTQLVGDSNKVLMGR